MNKFVLSCFTLLSLSVLSRAQAAPQLLVELGHSNLITNLAFSPDEKTLATASVDGSIRLWDENGAWRSTLLANDGIRPPITALAFSADGKLLAAGARDGSVRLWSLPEKSGLYLSALKLWKFGDGTIARQDATEGEQPRKSRMGDDEITTLSFSRDGKWLAVGGYYGHLERTAGGARLRVWNTENGESKWTQTFFDGPVSYVAFEASGELVAAREPNIVQRFNAEGREQKIITLPEEGARRGLSTLLAISPDGTRILAKGKDDYKIYNAQNGQMIVALEANPAAENPMALERRRAMAERITGRAMPDRAMTAASPADRLGSPVGAMFSSDSQSVAVVFMQNGARIWNVADGKETANFVTRSSNGSALALTKNGVLALRGKPSEIALWQNGELKTTLSHANNAVTALEYFMRGSEPILLVGYRDGALGQWNLATGKIEKITGQTGRDLTAMAVSPDGSILAVAGYLKTYTLTLQESGVGRGQLQAIDLRDNKVLWSRQDAGRSKLSQLRFTSNSSQLIIASEGSPGRGRAGAVEGEGFAPLEVLNARSGESLGVPFPLEDEPVSAARTLELSDSESKLAIDGVNDIRVWDVPQGKLRLRLSNSSFGRGSLLKFSPGGELLALTNPRGDGEIRLWDVTRERDTRRGRGNDAADVRLKATPDGVIASPILSLGYSGSRLLAGDAHGRILAWSGEMPEKGEPAAPPSIFEEETATSITALRGTLGASLPHVAATGHADGTVRLWDLKDKKLLVTLTLIPKPEAEAPTVLNLKQPEGETQSLEKYDWITWTPDGKYDSSLNAEKLLRWREGEATVSVPGDITVRRRTDVLPLALKAIKTH